MTFKQELQQPSFSLKNDILSGLTVALALVPEAVAFSFVANVSPYVGLSTAFIMCLVASILGGRPAMISAATGAISIISVGLVVNYGIEYLFAAAVMMGLIQILIGVLKFGKFIRLVPKPVMMGFVNGLAVLIFMAQLGNLKVDGSWMSGSAMWIMLGFIALTMLIIHFLPRFTKVIPSSLAAIIIVSILIITLGVDTKTVGDIASIGGGLPSFHIPNIPFTLEAMWVVLPYALIMAVVGLLESLLTLSVLDDMTGTRGRGNKECIAQGTANITTGFFGGMGGCALIGQSIMNVRFGSRTRISGLAAGFGLLMIVLFGAPLVEKVPIASLVGLMFIVCIETFSWASLKIFKKVPITDVAVMLIVTGVTIASHNLAVAVLIGVIISALSYAWNSAKKVTVESFTGVSGRYYTVNGPLFFGSVTNFTEKFNPKDDPKTISIDFKDSRIFDHSAIEAIKSVISSYHDNGKFVILKHLSEDCRSLLNKAADHIEVMYDDPEYKVSDDKLD
jgi:SulP family sulfate permease